jgi:hypothetical protein
MTGYLLRALFHYFLQDNWQLSFLMGFISANFVDKVYLWNVALIRYCIHNSAYQFTAFIYQPSTLFYLPSYDSHTLCNLPWYGWDFLHKQLVSKGDQLHFQ